MKPPNPHSPQDTFTDRVKTGLSIRRVLMIGALTLAWCGLWQDISPANLIAGVSLSTVVLASGAGTSGKGTIRVRPLLRLLWVVLIDLIKSTVDVAKEIVVPADTTNEAIIAVEVPRRTKEHFLLLVVAITLTPGTAVVDADPDTATLYLHLLHYERAAAVRAHVQELAELANQALPMTAPTISDVMERTAT